MLTKHTVAEALFFYKLLLVLFTHTISGTAEASGNHTALRDGLP